MGQRLILLLLCSLFSLISSSSSFTNNTLFPPKIVNRAQGCLRYADKAPLNCVLCIKGFFLSTDYPQACIQCASAEKCDNKFNPNNQLDIHPSSREVELDMIPSRLLSPDNCEYGFFLSPDGSCQQCSSNCQNCISYSSNCTSCPVQFNLIDFRCVYDCPFPSLSNGTSCLTNCMSTYFRDNFTGQCTKCDDNCQECSISPKQCLSCKQGLFLQNQKCLSQCLLGYFNNLGVCLECPEGCSSCLSQSSCIQCKDGYFFSSEDQLCFKCDTKCIKCSGGSSKDCTECQQGLEKSNEICTQKGECWGVNGYFYSNNSCLNKCQDNCLKCKDKSLCLECSESFFLQINSEEGVECQSCHSSCLTCSGNSKYDCIICRDLFYFLNNECLDECPIGTYKNSLLRTCTLCSHSTQYCSICNSDSKCVSCISHFYIDSTHTCKPCHDNCLYCFGKESNQCTICAKTNTVSTNASLCNNCTQGLFQDGTRCFKLSLTDKCPLGTFIDYQNQVCQPCSQKCSSCSSISICNSCTNDSYYLNTEMECIECSNNNSNCARCVSSFLCIQCQQNFKLENGMCVQTCPPTQNYYLIANSNICSLCPKGCSTCSQISSTKISCSNCFIGYYLNTDQMTCTACPASCKICSSSSNCQQCNLNYFLQNNHQTNEGQCVQSCNQGSYSEQISRLCVDCQLDNCNSCSSSSLCNTCADGYFFLQIDNSCSQCSSPCSSCVGSSTNCTSCIKGRYLYNNPSGDKTCVQSCDKSQYLQFNTCINCSAKCEFCISDSYCQGCSDGYYLELSSENVLNSICLKCSEECATCQGGSRKECSSCNEGYYLIDSKCISFIDCDLISNRFPNVLTHICEYCHPLCEVCVSSNISGCNICLPGYYLNNSTNYCQSCDSDCFTCVDSSNKCTSCFSNTFLSNYQCLSSDQDCLNFYYKDYDTLQCEKCISPCLNCIGKTIYECTECIEGYYYDQQSVEKCIQCDKNCVLCSSNMNSGSIMVVCQLCQNGYYLQITDSGSSCQACPPNNFSQNNICYPCDSSCSQCIGETNLECTNCPSKQYLQLNAGSQTGKCVDCAINCQECFNSQINSCLSCPKGYFYYSHQCYLDKCPFNLFADASGLCICKIEGCNQCEFDSQSQKIKCLACQDSFFILNETSCVQSCPPLLLKDIDNFSCVQQCKIDEYFFPELKQCSKQCSLFILQSDSIDSQSTNLSCLSMCPDGYYQQKQQRKCLLCNPLCKTCFGPSNNECYSCSTIGVWQQSTTTCKTECMQGYVLGNQINENNSTTQICKICKKNCWECAGERVLLEGDCLERCPLGYKINQQILANRRYYNRCVEEKDQTVQIINEERYDLEGVSSLIDLEIEAVVLNLKRENIITKIDWKVHESTDENISFLFNDRMDIIQNRLTLVIPCKYLRGGHEFVFQINVQIEGHLETILTKKVKVKTIPELSKAKYSADDNINSTQFIDQNGQHKRIQLNKSYFSISIDHIQTDKLKLRISCENIYVWNQQLPFSSNRIILLENVSFSQNQEQIIQFNSDNILIPLSIQKKNYICSWLVYLPQYHQKEEEPQDYSMTDQPQNLNKQEQYVFSNLTVIESEFQSRNEYLISLMQGNKEIDIKQVMIIANSIDDVIFQIDILDIQKKQMNINIQPQDQTSKSWSEQLIKELFPNCSIEKSESHMYCTCNEKKIGLLCQYDRENHSILIEVSDYLLVFLQKQLNFKVNNDNVLSILVILRKFLSFQLQISLDTINSTLELLSQVRTNYYEQVALNELTQDCLQILFDMQIAITLSELVTSNKLALLKQVEQELLNYLALSSQMSNLGDNSIIFSFQQQTILLTFQSQHPQTNESNDYLIVQLADLSIELPQQFFIEWNQVTLVQTKSYLSFQDFRYDVFVTPIYEINLFSKKTQNRIQIFDLPYPIRISITLLTKLIELPEQWEVDIAFQRRQFLESIECVSYNGDINQWTTEGVMKVGFKEESNQIVCETIHLSKFGVRRNESFLSQNYSSIIGIQIKQEIIPITQIELKPTQKSQSLLLTAQTNVIQQIKLKQVHKTPFYMDSLMDVKQKEMAVLQHFTFEGIVPFQYPHRFIEPFGIIIVVVIIASLVLTELLTYNKVIEKIGNKIKSVIDKIKEKREQKRQLVLIDEAKKKNDIAIQLENIDKQAGRIKRKSRLSVMKRGDEGFERKGTQNKDIKFFKKLRNNIHLIYEDDNLATPQSRRAANTKPTEFNFTEVAELVKQQQKDGEKQILVEPDKAKDNVDKDDMSFGAMAAKIQNPSSGTIKKPQFSFLKKVLSPTNANAEEYKKSETSELDKIYKEGGVYSPSAFVQRSNKRMGSYCPSPYNNKTQPAPLIFCENDFFVAEKTKAKQRNSYKASKFNGKKLKGKTEEKKQYITITNPVKLIKWYFHHSLISLIFKSTQTQVSKCLQLCYLHITILSIASIATISNNLGTQNSYLISLSAGPCLNYIIFGIYNLIFFNISQSKQYQNLRGSYLIFDQTMHENYIRGYIMLFILLFIGYSILLIEFGQKQYIFDTLEVVNRFLVLTVVDLFGVESLSLFISFFIGHSKNFSAMAQNQFFLLKGNVLQFSEISHFYLQKSLKEKNEHRRIQDISFKGDLQNYKREILNKNKQVQGSKKKKQPEKKIGK